MTEYNLYAHQKGLIYADQQRTLHTYGNAHSQLVGPKKILINNDGDMPRIKPDGTYGGGCFYNRFKGIKNAVAFNPPIDCGFNVQMKPYVRNVCCAVIKVNPNPKAPCCEKPTINGSAAVPTWRPNPRIIPAHHA